MLALVVLVFGVTSTSAAASNGGTTVVRSQITTFTSPLTSATCPNLPAGTVITASGGTQTSVTTQRTDPTGVTTIHNTTTIRGTATDQNGNAYTFQYSNQFRISNTVANPNVFSGLMTDVFVLSGTGSIGLNNGFVAELTITSDFSNVLS